MYALNQPAAKRERMTWQSSVGRFIVRPLMFNSPCVGKVTFAIEQQIDGQPGVYRRGATLSDFLERVKPA